MAAPLAILSIDCKHSISQNLLMNIARGLDRYNPQKGEAALTIGNFDGVHLGHQALLKALKQYKSERSVVITFENHPSQVLNPESATPLLCTLDHKLKLLNENGVDDVILIPFTAAFAQQKAEDFLQRVRERCPFSHLILGPDAAFGKNRHGDRTHMEAYANEQHFHLDYLEPLTVAGTQVSSSLIRNLIQKGDLQAASKLLGRRYSVYSSITKGQGLGGKIGFPTLNIDVDGLCLPPLGVYAVQVNWKGRILNGVANLGVAPTVRKNNKPLLEVHLLDCDEDVSGLIEVIYMSYIRAEKKFDNIEQLKQQIGKDKEKAKQDLQKH